MSFYDSEGRDETAAYFVVQDRQAGALEKLANAVQLYLVGSLEIAKLGLLGAGYDGSSDDIVAQVNKVQEEIRAL